MNELSRLILDTLLRDSPFYIFWKDDELVYRGGNQLFVKAIGAESIQDIVNKTDYDLPWKAAADQYRDSDLRVLAGEKIINKRETRYFEGGVQKITLINKLPLRDENGNIRGIVGLHQEMLVAGSEVINISNNLEKNELISIIKKMNKELTSKEIICLSLWLSGYSIKESSQYMHLSNKSIESYRTSVKNKLKISYKNQLINLINANDTYHLFLALSRIITKRAHF